MESILIDPEQWAEVIGVLGALLDGVRMLQVLLLGVALVICSVWVWRGTK